MTRGRELPVNSKVRRRLFSEDEPPPKKQSTWEGDDYLSCIRKTEYIAKSIKNEVILKGMKWNFDFEHELPMNGPISWYRKGNTGEWVGMRPTGRTISMRKRNRDPSAIKSCYHAERSSKVRRLSQSSVAHRRGFFNDGRALENAINQAKDDNFTNAFMDETPDAQIQEVPWNFDYDNSVPLQGPVYWHQVGDEWVGHRPGFPMSVVIFKDIRPSLRMETLLGITASIRGASYSFFNRNLQGNNSTRSIEEAPSTIAQEEPEKEVKDNEEGNETDKGDKTEEGDAVKVGEKLKEVNDALNDVEIGNTVAATDDSDMAKRLSVISIDKGNAPEGNSDDLSKENTNMETQDEEKANDMKKLNEATPRNAKNEQGFPRSRKSKKARKLYFNRH